MSRRAVVFGRCLGALVALAAAAGCLFDTRDPVPPTELEAQCPLTELTHPDSVAVGLIVAVECRDSTGAPTGIPNYERLLAPDFQFIPESSDSAEFMAEHEGFDWWPDWDKRAEVDVFSNLATNMDSIDLDLTERALIGGTELDANYVLTTYQDGNARIYNGSLKLFLSLDVGNWKISRWQDVRGDSTSWGRLKIDTRASIGS